MRMIVIYLVGAAVFIFPCAWDSAPHTIPPAAAIIAKVSAIFQTDLHVQRRPEVRARGFVTASHPASRSANNC